MKHPLTNLRVILGHPVCFAQGGLRGAVLCAAKGVARRQRDAELLLGTDKEHKLAQIREEKLTRQLEEQATKYNQETVMEGVSARKRPKNLHNTSTYASLPKDITHPDCSSINSIGSQGYGLWTKLWQEELEKRIALLEVRVASLTVSYITNLRGHLLSGTKCTYATYSSYSWRGSERGHQCARALIVILSSVKTLKVFLPT
eukprot:7358319-Pyramimonas_sp.AAC.1